jgi:hypothetical protein
MQVEIFIIGSQIYKLKNMKKLILLSVMVLVAFFIKAQDAKITITDAWTDASTDNFDQLTEWVVKGELTGIPGTKEYYIADTWNPGNGDLNAIRTAGGDTENWALYWVVNDTNFFYQPVSDLMGENIVSVKSYKYTPNKTWGEYLRQSHLIYYRNATNPDQYWILAADIDGNLLSLDEVVTIRLEFSSYMPSYVTQPTVTANQDKVQRKSDGTF